MNSVSFLCTPDLNLPWAVGLMVVTNRQHQRDEATQHQNSNFHLAKSLASTPSSRSVTVATSPNLREDMDSGHVEEGASRKEHGDTGGTDVWQGLFAALWGRTNENIWLVCS